MNWREAFLLIPRGNEGEAVVVVWCLNNVVSTERYLPTIFGVGDASHVIHVINWEEARVLSAYS